MGGISDFNENLMKFNKQAEDINNPSSIPPPKKEQKINIRSILQGISNFFEKRLMTTTERATVTIQRIEELQSKIESQKIAESALGHEVDTNISNQITQMNQELGKLQENLGQLKAKISSNKETMATLKTTNKKGYEQAKKQLQQMVSVTRTLVSNYDKMQVAPIHVPKKITEVYENQFHTPAIAIQSQDTVEKVDVEPPVAKDMTSEFDETLTTLKTQLNNEIARYPAGFKEHLTWDNHDIRQPLTSLENLKRTQRQSGSQFEESLTKFKHQWSPSTIQAHVATAGRIVLLSEVASQQQRLFSSLEKYHLPSDVTLRAVNHTLLGDGEENIPHMMSNFEQLQPYMERLLPFTAMSDADIDREAAKIAQTYLPDRFKQFQAKLIESVTTFSSDFNANDRLAALQKMVESVNAALAPQCQLPSIQNLSYDDALATLKAMSPPISLQTMTPQNAGELMLKINDLNAKLGVEGYQKEWEARKEIAFSSFNRVGTAREEFILDIISASPWKGVLSEEDRDMIRLEHQNDRQDCESIISKPDPSDDEIRRVEAYLAKWNNSNKVIESRLSDFINAATHDTITAGDKILSKYSLDLPSVSQSLTPHYDQQAALFTSRSEANPNLSTPEKRELLRDIHMFNTDEKPVLDAVSTEINERIKGHLDDFNERVGYLANRLGFSSQAEFEQLQQAFRSLVYEPLEALQQDITLSNAKDKLTALEAIVQALPEEEAMLENLRQSPDETLRAKVEKALTAEARIEVETDAPLLTVRSDLRDFDLLDLPEFVAIEQQLKAASTPEEIEEASKALSLFQESLPQKILDALQQKIQDKQSQSEEQLFQGLEEHRLVAGDPTVQAAAEELKREFKSARLFQNALPESRNLLVLRELYVDEVKPRLKTNADLTNRDIPALPLHDANAIVPTYQTFSELILKQSRDSFMKKIEDMSSGILAIYDEKEATEQQINPGTKERRANAFTQFKQQLDQAMKAKTNSMVGDATKNYDALIEARQFRSAALELEKTNENQIETSDMLLQLTEEADRLYSDYQKNWEKYTAIPPKPTGWFGGLFG